MSISKPNTESKNPSTQFIRFKNGKFSSYDKEKKENVEIPLPINFVVIDELSTVSGFDDVSQSGIYSNEVHFTTNDKMTVKAFKGGVIAEGLYKEIKARVNSAGGRYTKSVYAMFNDDLVNFQLSGAALSSWINDLQKVVKEEVWITVKETKEGKKGAVTYKTPVFEVGSKIDKKDFSKACVLDNTLQEYLAIYKQARKEEKEGNEIQEDAKETFEVKDPIHERGEEDRVKPEDLPF